MTQCYDVLILGGGPGGYTAALYCARAGLSALVIEQLAPGGQMAATGLVENYPGFPDGADGFELGDAMRRQAERFGAKTLLAQVTAVQLEGKIKHVTTTAGPLSGRTAVLAVGARPRPLGLAQEEALRGRGVTYCAACDGMLFRGKEVAVVGGGNTAVHDALLLAKLGCRVTLIHRRDRLRAAAVYETTLREAGVALRLHTRATELLSNGRLTGLKLEDTVTGEVCTLPCEGLFIAAGRIPDTQLFQGQLELDEAGYLVADETTRTSLPGVFAVGDVRRKAVRQIVTAVADGAAAAHFIGEYLNA